MKIIFHHDFYRVYTSDPAAAPERMESIVKVISGHYEFVEPTAAREEDIAAVHSPSHIEHVKGLGIYSISALAAGGAIQAAFLGLKDPCFALIRPPGHHASADTSWGFCYFNNMAVALEKLKTEKAIKKAFVLDIDFHFGDGTVNIFKGKDYVSIFNPSSNNREDYLEAIAVVLGDLQSDVIGISAGFDNHRNDWGGLLETEDYVTIGRMVKEKCNRENCGYFAILEGGYKHEVLGHNVMALLNGMAGR
ncbi:MAG: histone deacetylase family protein [Deltaproteobacteria bacterium]|nr:MAG: histone deacetylase family protein [Deltaproteobacteria bacterium]